MKVSGKILAMLILFLFGPGFDHVSTPVQSSQNTSFTSYDKIAFSNVDVISMESEGLFENKTVLVEEGIIKAIQNSTQAISSEYKVIDGSGKYLMPGLADMHTHAIEDNDMFLYLANGVTKVRHMWGGDRSLALKERIAKGEVLGPRFFAASPGFEEPPSYWPGPVLMNDIDEIDSLVLAQKERGFDFIKAYSNMSANMYEALMKAASKHGIQVVGHVSPRVGIEKALEFKQASIAHIDGYMNYVLKSTSDINRPSTYELDEKKLKEIVQKTIEAGVWNCPTITITTRNLSQKEALISNPELRFVSPNMKSWFVSRAAGLNAWNSESYSVHKRKLIRKMHQMGAKLMLGVDTGLRYLLPGFTVHEELENFVECGLNPYEALKTATTNPALFLDIESGYGSIAVGKRADMVLLASNPLENIGNTRKIEGVLMDRLWMPKQEIQKKLEEIANSN